MLIGGVDMRFVDEVAELQCEIFELEVLPDHVYMLCEVDSQFGMQRFVKRVKGQSSRLLRQALDGLSSRLPTLWTHSYFVVTVGGAPIAIIQQSIEHQKNV
jgi:putative transposase